MKVGDLIKYESVMNDSMDKYSTAYGIIVQLSRTGHTTMSAQVLFNDGDLAWFDSHVLEVVSEAGR